MSLLGGALGGGGAAGAGDIWSTGAFSFESPLKDLLDSGNYSTEDLLAQDELLQELRGLHPQLTQYFGTEQVVTQLLHYVILGPNDATPMVDTATAAAAAPSPLLEQVPSDEPDEAVAATAASIATATATATTPPPGEWLYRYLEKRSSGDKKPAASNDPVLVHVRFPYMACEILCSELPQTIDTLVEGYVVETDDYDKQDQQQQQPVVQASATDDSVEVSTPPPPPTSSSVTRPRLLDLLFSVLHKCAPGQLDDYRAGYLDKILTVLFRRRPEAMTEYMNSGGQYDLETLQRALLQHLYSYSVTQISQRLLLPPRPKAQTAPAAAADGSTDPNATMSGEAALAPSDGQDILGGEDPDDDPDPDMNGAGIKCDWYKSKHAVEWLLDLLQGKSIGEKESVMTEEQRLAMSMNASEVFITIIQNSMLSSDTMLTLTSVKTWQRLIQAVLPPAPNAPFSAHESFQTSAMNVIESLVLQLGGYGAVGTMTLLPEGEEDADEAAQAQQDQQAHELIADLENLLQVLPDLLQGFAKLLLHPSTKEWQSKMQFSQHVPVALLGMSRLKIVRVLESLVLLGDPDIDHCLVESDCLRICLDLFWQFQWCSMLHQSVANLLVHVFEGQNVRFEIQEYFLVQCNLLGRLMDSFGKAEHVIEQAKAAVPDAAALTDSADPLPVSEDDVDAAMEVTEDNKATPTSTTARGVVDTPVSQSFRLGYMGHVIIICQALVQACTNEWATSGESAMGEGGSLSARLAQPHSGGAAAGGVGGTSADMGDSTVKTGDTSELEPLMIAELVKNHELSEQWKEFVATTLSSEITTQSTPLGGFSGPCADPLATHRPGMELPSRRPGLADDDMDMGMGAAASQPPPPRGMLSGGDTIDMDDNDLEVAATMLSNLHLGRPNTTATADDSDNDSGQFSGSGDSEKSYNSGETNNSGGGYAFDDPLGQTGGLGIELGKLTKMGTTKKKKPAPEQPPTEPEADNDDDDHSSSDEEPPRPDSDDEPEGGEDEDNNSNGEDDNVPVMDLFAGNFNHGQTSPGDDKPASAKDEAEFGAFANFDAFAGSPAPEELPPPTSEPKDEAPSLDLFAKAPPPDHDDFVQNPKADDDGFGDFVSAEPDVANKAGEPDPFDSAFDAGSDLFSSTSKKSEDFTPAMDPFAVDDKADEQDDNFGGSGTFKTSFTGTSFDDLDDIKTAPSDELAADAAAAVPPDNEEAKSEDASKEEGVLVSSSS